MFDVFTRALLVLSSTVQSETAGTAAATTSAAAWFGETAPPQPIGRGSAFLSGGLEAPQPTS
jgi:hypothetical protein